jgi:hypothetical protein
MVGAKPAGDGDLSIPQIQHRLVNFAVSTYFHLLFPAFLGCALADRSIDEPAKVPGIKLPCGAILPVRGGTTASQPTGLGLLGSAAFQGQNKQDLALNMHGDVPPALFETLNGFRRNAQDLCHLVLRFLQVPTNCRELDSLHFSFIPLSLKSYHNVGREGSLFTNLHSAHARKFCRNRLTRHPVHIIEKLPRRGIYPLKKTWPNQFSLELTRRLANDFAEG